MEEDDTLAPGGVPLLSGTLLGGVLRWFSAARSSSTFLTAAFPQLSDGGVGSADSARVVGDGVDGDTRAEVLGGASLRSAGPPPDTGRVAGGNWRAELSLDGVPCGSAPTTAATAPLRGGVAFRTAAGLGDGSSVGSNSLGLAVSLDVGEGADLRDRSDKADFNGLMTFETGFG